MPPSVRYLSYISSFTASCGAVSCLKLKSQQDVPPSEFCWLGCFFVCVCPFWASNSDFIMGIWFTPKTLRKSQRGSLIRRKVSEVWFSLTLNNAHCMSVWTRQSLKVSVCLNLQPHVDMRVCLTLSYFTSCPRLFCFCVQIIKTLWWPVALVAYVMSFFFLYNEKHQDTASQATTFCFSALYW